MSVVTSAGGHKCRWSQVSVVTSAGGHKCRWSQVSVVTSAGGHKCRWSQVSVVTSVGDHKCRTTEKLYELSIFFHFRITQNACKHCILQKSTASVFLCCFPV